MYNDYRLAPKSQENIQSDYRSGNMEMYQTSVG